MPRVLLMFLVAVVVNLFDFRDNVVFSFFAILDDVYVDWLVVIRIEFENVTIEPTINIVGIILCFRSFS